MLAFPLQVAYIFIQIVICKYFRKMHKKLSVSVNQRCWAFGYYWRIFFQQNFRDFITTLQVIINCSWLCDCAADIVSMVMVSSKRELHLWGLVETQISLVHEWTAGFVTSDSVNSSMLLPYGWSVSQIRSFLFFHQWIVPRHPLSVSMWIRQRSC